MDHPIDFAQHRARVAVAVEPAQLGSPQIVAQVTI
jgi:hypothetical protein